MELEEMQTAWSEMSDQLQKQKLLTNKLIMEMTQERYKNKFSKLSTYETIGSVICFIAGLVILMHFNRLDTWYLKIFGILTVAYLFVLPITVLRSINKIRSINFAKSSYKDTLMDFAKRKKRMLSIQKLGISLNFIFIIILLPVTSKIVDGNDILTADEGVWVWYIPVMGLVMILVSLWGYRHYKNIANSAENMIKELRE